MQAVGTGIDPDRVHLIDTLIVADSPQNAKLTDLTLTETKSHPDVATEEDRFLESVGDQFHEKGGQLSHAIEGTREIGSPLHHVRELSGHHRKIGDLHPEIVEDHYHGTETADLRPERGDVPSRGTKIADAQHQGTDDDLGLDQETAGVLDQGADKDLQETEEELHQEIETNVVEGRLKRQALETQLTNVTLDQLRLRPGIRTLAQRLVYFNKEDQIRRELIKFSHQH